MAATISTVHIPTVLDPAKSEIFLDGFLGEQVEYPALFSVSTAGTKTIEKASLLPPASYQTGVEGEPIPTSVVAEGNTVTYSMVEQVIGYEVAALALRFIDQPALGSFIRMLGASAARKVNADCMATITTGFTSTGPDGVPLYSNSHPTETAAVIDNLGTTELDNAALEAAMIVGLKMQSPEGLLSPVYYDTLMVAPDRLFAAEQTVGNLLKHDSGDTFAENNINVVGRRIKLVIASPDASDANDWWCFDSTRSRFNLYWATMPNPQTWVDMDSGNYKATDRMIYAVGHDNTWRSTFGAQVA